MLQRIQPTIVLETITPSLAELYMQKNRGNRVVNQRQVATYAQSMLSHSWFINGQTIGFDVEGWLMNGQHRLLGCIKSGVPFQTYVARGIDRDVFDTIDVGRKRTSADVLGITGCKNAVATAGAIRLIIAVRSGQISNTRQIEPDETRLFHTMNPSVERSVVFTMACRAFLQPSAAAAMHFLFAEKSVIEADRFFNDLSSGADLPVNDPVYVLRESLVRQRMKKARLPVMEIAARIVRAWMHRRAGKTTTTLKGMVRTDGGLKFPEIA